MQMLNHALPIKLDKDNYMLWITQMENLIYANGLKIMLKVLQSVLQKQQAMVKQIQNLFFGKDLTE